jgi:outer membrane protein OmpA-like peptidoglycan-associated protein
MKTTSLGLMTSVAALVCAACGTAATTTELVAARNAYAQARNSDAAQLNPTGVHQADQALQIAEGVHREDPGSAKEKHYAYIAARKAERAVAEAGAALAVAEQQRAKQGYEQALEHRASEVATQRSQYAEQLDQTQRALQQNSAQLEQREQELAITQRAAQAAQEQLRKSESMREEAGRMIISLSGGVMFQTGGSELSAQARQRLDTVANALSAYPDRDIVVEGHTDSQGNDEANRELSQRRAEAVRGYLVSRGVPDARIRAVGRGEAEPVATNDTAEGRASNRRVEVVVEPQRAGAQQSPGVRPRRDARTPDAPPSPDAPTGADEGRSTLPSSDTPAQSAPATR